MSASFQGKPVLDVGPGQCVDCARAIVRLLVQHSFGRTWHVAEISGTGFVPHTCSTRDRPPVREAA